MGGLRDGHLDRGGRRANLVRDETFKGEAKRGFCPTCGSRVAAIDSDIPEIGINVTALDDTSGPDLVPIHASFRENAVHWLPPVPETEHSTAG
ncbi:glutathione-dependent formaldehyde-activating GFA [Streptomyces sp. W007]|nr:glutathione-dependent formaldehyde-activating GFA [Streptomyces sp. W007]